MGGRKNFINNTSKVLMITLSVRKGDDPNNGNEGILSFPLAANSSSEESYGNDQNVYLNALKYAWTDGEGKEFGLVEVGVRGDTSDDLMNTNSIMTFIEEEDNIMVVASN